MSLIGIYKITAPDYSTYIGQSWDIETRFKKNYKNAGLCKNQPKLSESFNKYGRENHKFEVLQELESPTQNYMNQREQFYMDLCKEYGLPMLNIRMAGNRGKHSDETIAKMKANYGKWMIGRKLSEETKKKQSLSLKGVKKPPRTAIHALHISLSNKGRHGNTPTRSVYQLTKEWDVIKTWPSIKSAAMYFNIKTPSNITSVCKGKRNYAGGFRWAYKY